MTGPFSFRRRRRTAAGALQPPMKIYFSCSLTGGRADQAVYAAIVDHLMTHAHDVLTAHLARPEVMTQEQAVDAREVYERDIHWVKDAQVLIAEVSTPSHGVGYEIALALMLGKPVLCLYRQNARVSKMITGNSQPTLTVATYLDPAGALAVVRRFLVSQPST
jgi:2'-deoxynucleoside 5'-phosphate N-hydrolase